MATPNTSEVTLRLERTIAAPPEKVFDAWIQPQSLIEWFAPAEGFQTVVHRLEPKVGGRFRIEMREPGGKVHIVGGEYRELSPPKRIAFTWTWEGKPEEGDSLVTVQFTPEGKGTKVVLIHEQLPSAQVRDSHAHGWTGILERLVRRYPAAS